MFGNIEESSKAFTFQDETLGVAVQVWSLESDTDLEVGTLGKKNNALHVYVDMQ